MAEYVTTFTKPYPSGYQDLPSEATPVGHEIIESWENAIVSLESYLSENNIQAVSASTTVNSGTKTATITIDGIEYVLYSPSVSYESAITGGTKVGTITVGANTFDVYAPASSAGGSTVSVVPKTLTGTNIAEITVDGTTYQLYAPTGGSTVTAEATLTEGTQIGKITIDGVETILYAPTASPIIVDSELSATSENPVQNKVVKAEFDNVNSNLSVIGKCKNLLNTILQTTTMNGIECTNNGDGTYTLNGTVATGNYEQFTLLFNKISAGTYKLVGNPDYSLGCELYFSDHGGTEIDCGNGSIVNFASDTTTTNLYLYIPSGVTLTNVVFKPMLTTNLNATYDDFVPYTGDGDTLTHDVAELKNDLTSCVKYIEIDEYSTGGQCSNNGIYMVTCCNPNKSTEFATVLYCIDYGVSGFVKEISNNVISVDSCNQWGTVTFKGSSGEYHIRAIKIS